MPSRNDDFVQNKQTLKVNRLIISRYITKELLWTLTGILSVLMLVFLCQQFVRYLNYAALGKIPTNILLELVGFEIPYLLALLMPLGLYLSLLVVFSRLIADNEMAILHLNGFSGLSFLRLSFFISLAFSGFILVLMVWANPLISAKRQQVMATDKATVGLIQTLIPGRFQKSPNGRQVMYVEKLSVNRLQAENVFLAHQKDSNKQDKIERHPWMVVFAKKGFQTHDPITHAPNFVTTDGHRYEGTPGDNAYKIINFKKYTAHLPQAEPKLIHPDVESLTMTQLWQNYQKPKYAAEWQWRFSIAIAVILLGVLSVSVSSIRPRQGRYLILLPAVLIYIVYMDMLFIARRWVEQGSISTSIGIWWIHVLMFIFVAMVSWWRLKTWGRV